MPRVTTRALAAIGLAVLTTGCAQRPVQPQVFASLPGYTEGIVFDTSGVPYVSVLTRGTVSALRDPKAPEPWHRATEPNGHKILPDGTHLIAARGGVRHVDANGALIEVLAPELETPNDLALDGDGGVYITVPAASESDRKARRSGVYYLDASRTLRKVADDLNYPNGIVVFPDGKTLVVDDSGDRRLTRFSIDAPGVLSGRRVLAEIPDPKSIPDGMTIDRAGLLYMADYGRGVVVVLRPSGQIIREYPTGLEHPSNVAFGGAKLTDLYVTGSPSGGDGTGSLVLLPIGVPGRGGSTLPATNPRR